MVPSHTTKGQKCYRYFVCSNAQKRDWAKCPAKSIPAPEIERFVVEQIRRVGENPDLINATVAQTQQLTAKRLADLDVEVVANHCVSGSVSRQHLSDHKASRFQQRTNCELQADINSTSEGRLSHCPSRPAQRSYGRENAFDVGGNQAGCLVVAFGCDFVDNSQSLYDGWSGNRIL
jgi:hypothetical protein